MTTRWFEEPADWHPDGRAEWELMATEEPGRMVYWPPPAGGLLVGPGHPGLRRRRARWWCPAWLARVLPALRRPASSVETPDREG